MWSPGNLMGILYFIMAGVSVYLGRSQSKILITIAVALLFFGFDRILSEIREVRKELAVCHAILSRESDKN